MSTYQRWDFSGGPGGGAPDVQPFLNPYGTPSLFPVGATTWFATPGPGVPPRPFVWDIGPFSRLGVSADNIQLPVPNGGTAGCKQVVVSITFFGGEPEVTVEPVAGHGSFGIREDSEVFIPQPDGWTFVRYDYTLYAPSSPNLENVFVTDTTNAPTWIDYEVIDTRVPAPAAGAVLLGFGVTVLLRRRR